MKVKQVVIEWEEGGSSIFSQRDGALVNQICELQEQLAKERNHSKVLRAETVEVHQLLTQAKEEIVNVNRVRVANYDLYVEISGKYNKLCKQIRDLV